MHRVVFFASSYLFPTYDAARLITRSRDPRVGLNEKIEDAIEFTFPEDIEHGVGKDIGKNHLIQDAIDHFDTSVFGDIEYSPYDFRERWRGLGFEERWDMFRLESPTGGLQGYYNASEDTGPVCHPTLVGPENSEKLAILTHGFLACPGMWYRVVPSLLEAGFRVMLPLLPGHGRHFEWASDGEVVDMDEIEKKNNSTPRNDKVKDNLDDMPTTAAPYLHFAEALKQLAEQWKEEHPEGLLVVAGHSLGGAITAKFAMEIPDVVDRVLLLSPMLGLKWKTIEIFAQLAPSMRLSKGSSCEGKRGRGSGGMCQFRLSHVLAMADFAFAVLCCQWGINYACAARYDMGPMVLLRTLGIITNTVADLSETMEVYRNGVRKSMCGQASKSSEALMKRKGMGKIKRIQVVTSKGENLVDNAQIEQFVGEFRKRRAMNTFGRSSLFKTDFCKWSPDVGHSYMSNRGSRKAKWWHPYLEGVVTDFLEDGKNIDIAERTSGGDYCMVDSDNVAGYYLTRLPATQHPKGYWVGSEGVSWPRRAEVLFNGGAVKESEWRKARNARIIEILRFESAYLIVTRLNRNENVRDIFTVRQEPILVVKEDGDCCMRPFLDYVDSSVPLSQAVVNSSRSSGKSFDLRFCGKGFLKVMCKVIGCKTDSRGTRATQSWLMMTCSENMEHVRIGAERDENVKKIRMRGDTFVQVPANRPQAMPLN